MPVNASSGKLAYIAILLVAAGFLLLYFIRTQSGPSSTASNEGAANRESSQPLGARAPDLDALSIMTTGDRAAVINALSSGMDPRAPIAGGPYKGLTPLHIAAARTLHGTIAPLINAGAEADSRAPDGRTALMFAAAQGSPQVISELLLANAAIDIRDHQGRTALMHAASASQAEAVDALLKAGADVKALDATGTSALAFASSNPGNTTIVSLILSAGADPEAPDAQGVTPLMRAAERADAELIVLLLNAGASPAAKSRDGRSALDRARTRQDADGKAVAGVLDHAGS